MKYDHPDLILKRKSYCTFDIFITFCYEGYEASSTGAIKSGSRQTVLASVAPLSNSLLLNNKKMAEGKHPQQQKIICKLKKKWDNIFIGQIISTITSELISCAPHVSLCVFNPCGHHCEAVPGCQDLL